MARGVCWGRFGFYLLGGVGVLNVFFKRVLDRSLARLSYFRCIAWGFRRMYILSVSYGNGRLGDERERGNDYFTRQ